MQLSYMADLDEAWNPVIPSFRLYQKEEPVDEEALKSWNISITDAWRLATSAERVEGITMDRESARALALTKLRAELAILGNDAFKAWLPISVEAVLTLFAKIMKPNGQKLLDFTLLVNEKPEDTSTLWVHALELLNHNRSIH